MNRTESCGPNWRRLPFAHAWISTRNAGDLGPSGADAGALARRAAALECIDFRPIPTIDHVLVCRQTHSRRILILKQDGQIFEATTHWNTDGKAEVHCAAIPGVSFDSAAARSLWVGSQDADGILTDIAELWPAVTVADCLPIVLTASSLDKTTHLRGVLHSGWGGTGILIAALTFLCQNSYREVKVLLGPCIGATDYPVPPERAFFFAGRFGQNSVRICSDGQPGLDLQAANAAILDGTSPCIAGNAPWVSNLSTTRAKTCTESTFCTDWAHSFRRDGAVQYGRMVCMVGDHS